MLRSTPAAAAPVQGRRSSSGGANVAARAPVRVSRRSLTCPVRGRRGGWGGAGPPAPPGAPGVPPIAWLARAATPPPACGR